ncbi:MAG: VWA domain-containing protein [Cytophagales bacterium]|nr:VWA domain-containing protein [Rhizobacter sp.]
MAEAEDVITDAARHATVFAQNLWRRHRPAPRGPAPVRLADVAQRLDLLTAAVFGRSFALRVAQPPAPPTFLAQVFLRRRGPPVRQAVPATDGVSIWLPDAFASSEPAPVGVARFRTMALQQAMRAVRGSAAHQPTDGPPLLRDLYLLLEAHAADQALLQALPGMAAALATLRREALQHRPPPSAFPGSLRPLESLARAVLVNDTVVDVPAEPTHVLAQARALLRTLQANDPRAAAGRLLWRDGWTGELRTPPAAVQVTGAGVSEHDHDPTRSDAPRSARLARRPDVRLGDDDQEDKQPGAWMVQTAQPHEQAEDPMGLQRPVDRESASAAEDFADAVSEMPEAQLVATPGRPKEVLLSDDPPASQFRRERAPSTGNGPGRVHYPEWDWRAGAYRDPGATVVLLPAPDGPQQWVDDTLAERRGMLHEIRRRFELLRAQRLRVHRQLDGHDIDLPAFVEAQADFRAGLPMAQRLYQSERRSRRDMAIMLLVDVSGSTDGWISAGRRVIDVEREALLLVCIALEGMAAPYSVQAFSGEGPNAVVVRSIKHFDEHYGPHVAQRIAGLEPEHYTRAGAAIRHATTLLMHEPAAHRLLLLLSDGKPNDIDDYEGRYGVEDMRQAVTEAKLQGISPFCLTIDRQAANYLPAVFGPHHYALLSRPELLPTVLLDWLRRLVVA